MKTDRAVHDSCNRNPTTQAGFSLIELMIAVAIIGILAAIALPSYSKSVVNSNRAAGEACLSNYANYMERFYATNLRYDQNSSGTAVALPSLDCASTANTGNNYDYSLNGTTTTSTFKVQAVPKNSQLTRDTQCGTLFLDQTGTRSVSATGNPVDTCWRH